MEVGPREQERNEYVLVSRTDRSSRMTVGQTELGDKVHEILELIQQQLFDRWAPDMCTLSVTSRVLCDVEPRLT